MSEGRVTGHCLCKAVVFEYDAAPKWTLYCHCESCRRAASAPAVVWISVPRASFRFAKGAPRTYQSSPGITRGFCGTCGSPLTYESERMPDEVHIYAAALADPTAVAPTLHVFAAEQLPWFEVADTLPRYAVTRAGGAQPLRHGPRADKG